MQTAIFEERSPHFLRWRSVVERGERGMGKRGVTTRCMRFKNPPLTVQKAPAAGTAIH